MIFGATYPGVAQLVERCPDLAEVDGSSPCRQDKWFISSIGRAEVSKTFGCGFDPRINH